MAHNVGISFNRIAEACALKAERVSQIAPGMASVTALATVENRRRAAHSRCPPETGCAPLGGHRHSQHGVTACEMTR